MPSQIVTIITLGFFTLFIGGAVVIAVGRMVIGGGELQDRLQTYGVTPEFLTHRDRGRRRSALDRLRIRLNMLLANVGSQELNIQLMSADWPITVIEYYLIKLGVTVGGFLLGWLFFGTVIAGGALAVITYLIPGIYLRWRIQKRQIAFERQLVDILVLLNGAVRAGFSLLQATEVVVNEMQPPASDEFQRVRKEVQLGLPLTQALSNLSERMHNPDLDLMVAAININYQVGGNLTTMLMAVTETIRDRMRLFSEVRVITTQQRYTGYLLSLLPFILGALMFLMSPDYMKRLFEPGGIICIPIGAVIGIILGHFSIRRLSRIEI